MKGRIKIIIFLGVIFILAFMIVSQEKIPSFLAGKYKMNGIDVSRYQGDIDWEIIEGQGIDFAFIKATEGSSHIDPCFEKNWEEAEQTSIFPGAYHFFSFDSNEIGRAHV